MKCLIKWLIRLITIIIMIVYLALSSVPVLAGMSTDVTVTAIGIVVAAPGGFTVYYISDYEVGMTWTKPVGANMTMIRAKYGAYPDAPPAGFEPTDGYLVYYGPAELASDTATSLDEIATQVYYRAWSVTTAGAWSPLYGEGLMEGIGMTLIAFVLLALGLTVATYVLKKPMLAFGAAGGWLVLGIYSYTKSTTAWDVYYGLFFFAMGMLIVCSLEPILMRQKKTPVLPLGEDEDTEGDEDYKEFAETNKRARERIDMLRSSGIGKARRRVRKTKKFENTGEL